MAYILTENVLQTASTVTTTFTSGSENASFPFANVYDGNSGNGFKSGSVTQPTVIVNVGGGVSVNAVGIYSTRDSAFTVTVYIYTFTTTDPNHASWVQMDFGRGGASITNLIINKQRSAVLGVTSANPVGNISSFKFVFSNLSSVDDVVNNISVGRAYEINIRRPYSPTMFKNFDVTTKRNNKGNPLLSSRIPAPVKLNLNTVKMTESDMKTLVNGIYAGITERPFFFTSSYDTASEDQPVAYYCIVDKQLDRPKYEDELNMSWNIKALGYT